MNGLRAVLVCVMIACVTALSPAPPADAAARPGWSDVPLPATAPPASVADVAARGPDEAWATGSESAAEGSRPLLLRWNGRTWNRDTGFPGAAEPGSLRTVRFVGEEMWIFRHRAGVGEILRRSAPGPDGSVTWSVVTVPRILWTYQDFVAVPGAAWVVGEDSTGLKVLRFDGSGWSEQRTPDGVLFLMGITARSATDAWAWADTTSGTAVLHWDGTSWKDAEVPLPANANVHTMLLEPAGRITVGGSQYTDGVGRTYLMTRSGGTWRTVFPTALGDAHTAEMVRGPDGALWFPMRSDRAFQSKYARVDGPRVTFTYGPARENAIEVKPQALTRAGAALLALGTAEIYGSKPNLMSERLGGRP
ncbi:hypothetical protein ACFYVL_31315 [Streptomyces sp. NPDC004111]|uniref:hypothetical protein n=1 Tax=Streptomyces sp. NPDC004111 TaxID=3364690 RepID=UPI003692DED1